MREETEDIQVNYVRGRKLQTRTATLALRPETVARRKALKKQQRRNDIRLAVGILVGVLFAAGILCVGISVFLVGGIVQIVHAAQAHPTDVSSIVWGSLRVLCTGFFVTLGWLIAWALGRLIAGD